MRSILDKAIAEKNASLKENFLKEWSNSEFRKMQKSISRHFSDEPMTTSHGNYPPMFLSFTAIADRLGLAFTSSSSYAGYWICNTEVSNPKYPGYKYVGFAMNSNKKTYAILWDKEENEIIIPL